MTLDVMALGELNPDLVLRGLPALPQLGREITAESITFDALGDLALPAGYRRSILAAQALESPPASGTPASAA